MANEVVRTAVMRIMSEMLDDPDEHGIYETGRFMDKIESLLIALMSAPDAQHLSGSEAIYGFVAWLTTFKDPVMMGAGFECAGLPDLIVEFCEKNELPDPRDEWHNLLIHPPADPPDA